MKERIIYWVRFVLTYKNFAELMRLRLSSKPITRVKFWNGFEWKAEADTLIGVVLDESLIQQKYRYKDIKVDKGDVVVDIGAHVGDFCLEAVRSGAAKVLAYEPMKRNFEFLSRNILSNKIRYILPRQKAVGGVNGRTTLYNPGLTVGGSLDRKLMGKNAVGEKVKIISLKQILVSEKIKQIDFLKIDCEGAEGKILKNFPETWFGRIKKLAIEYHDEVSILKHEQIQRLLEKNHFRVTMVPNGHQTGYIYAKHF
jgi:FkbM family methyltransferase